MKPWFYALTLKGDRRHVYLPQPGWYGLRGDALALCGKLVRYRLGSQWWTRWIPKCRPCGRIRKGGLAG